MAYIATTETDAYWAEKVEVLSSGPLSLFVQNSRFNSPASGGIEPVKSAVEEVRFEVRPELAGKLN